MSTWSLGVVKILLQIWSQSISLTRVFAHRLHQISAQVVIHAAAIASVPDCARDPERGRAVNVAATETIAQINNRLIFISTDLVFDGEKGNYAENDSPNPLSIYGSTKVDAERAVLAFSNHCVVRASLLYGPSHNGRASFFSQLVDSAKNGVKTRLFHDEWRTPLGLATAAEAIVEIALSDVTGLLHVGGHERMSRVEMGQRLAAHLGVSDEFIEKTSRLSAPGEPQPRDTSLDCAHWRSLFPRQAWPSFEESLIAMGVTSGAHTCR
jgi:dTDP-4-dehydrorhamnose reductase